MNQLCVKIKSKPITNCNPIKQIKVCTTTEVIKTYCVPVIDLNYQDALNRLKEIVRGIK